MKKRHARSKQAARVAEPVQVYLAPEDQARLARLADRLEASKSAVLRRGLEVLERQLTDPAGHPVLGIIGLADAEVAGPAGYDVARDHDRFLSESESDSWGGTTTQSGG